MTIGALIFVIVGLIIGWKIGEIMLLAIKKLKK